MSAASSGESLRQSAQPLIHAASGLWGQALHYVVAEPLLQVALGSIALVMVGGAMRRLAPMAGSVLRFFGNLGLIYAFLGAILQVAGGNGLLSGEEGAETAVSGRDTRITMAADGHFWVRAEVNGVPRRFLVDTGATLTTLSPEAADAAGLQPKRGRRQVVLNTANGHTTGTLATIDMLRVGNVVARHLDAVVAPGLGSTSVLGMNFLSRLASWRVEGKVMVLVPHHPAADGEEREKAGDGDGVARGSQ